MATLSFDDRIKVLKFSSLIGCGIVCKSACLAISFSYILLHKPPVICIKPMEPTSELLQAFTYIHIPNINGWSSHCYRDLQLTSLTNDATRTHQDLDSQIWRPQYTIYTMNFRTLIFNFSPKKIHFEHSVQILLSKISSLTLLGIFFIFILIFTFLCVNRI